MQRQLSRLLVGTICIFVALSLWTMLNQKVMVEKLMNNQKKEAPTSRNLGGRYDVIFGLCGELCDVTKPIKPGNFMGTVSSKVDCPALFHSDEIDRPSDHDPIDWKKIPENIKNEYNHYGQVQVKDVYTNDRAAGSGRKSAYVYTKKMVEDYIAAFKKGSPMGHSYVNASNIVNAAADHIGVEGKNILVIGTQEPWLEAVLLTKNPKKIITVEYSSIKSEYPNFEFITPQEFRDRYKTDSLPAFDVIFTFSSVEHSGLGRYGDALNPWGDIITIARAWCVSSPNAKLAVSVPVQMNDVIEFNAHRIYGPVLYPYLVTNWKFLWSSSGDYKPGPEIKSWEYQPVYVFEKQ